MTLMCKLAIKFTKKRHFLTEVFHSGKPTAEAHYNNIEFFNARRKGALYLLLSTFVSLQATLKKIISLTYS